MKVLQGTMSHSYVPVPLIRVYIILVRWFEGDASLSEPHKYCFLGHLLQQLVELEECLKLVGVCVGLHLFSSHLWGELDAVVEISKPEHHTVCVCVWGGGLYASGCGVREDSSDILMIQDAINEISGFREAHFAHDGVVVLNKKRNIAVLTASPTPWRK